MNLYQYIEIIAKRHKAGISSEHSYRVDLESLIRELVPGVDITNEPLKVTDCGNPDYVITKRKIPIGFIEAKDLGKDLNSKQYKEQFNRYKKALDNLIITDYLWFQFYQNGKRVHEIRIGEIQENTVIPLASHFEEFQDLIQDFCTFVSQAIKSPRKLAEMMAAKARLLQVILEKAVSADEETLENSTIKEQYESFKRVLIHDLKPKEFADIYAQTLAYGMFAARLHDTTLDDFSRQEAAELIPKTNPFLRKLFQYVAGYDIDERIKTTVDNLAEVFRATNVEALLKNLGKSSHSNDPIIHFYETFLAKYDPKLRKARGVWYTPAPVVNFIVRAVDELLQSDFGLKEGLADTSKTTIKVKVQGAAVSKGRYKGRSLYKEKEVHKVQILDPATGTGTFLAEVVKHIYTKRFKAMQGAWSTYVEDELIPRLNGFEILMASYSMAHLKLDMLLAETGYKATREQRFNIYLANSLEEHHPDTGTLFSTWLSSEANEANRIKRDTPVMVVMGNPPYSVSSRNKSKWIEKLMRDYKRDLNEKNINPLSDDYLKFIRYGQHFIEKNGEGILAYISNNSFIDGIIHRQMRRHLLETFNKIYILDLHGNTKKKETAPDGGKDENVFDIMQGVSINIFVKQAGKSSGLAQVFHLDTFGKRDEKYALLQENSPGSLPWNKLEYRAPEYFFVPKDYEALATYEEGFSVNSLFPINTSGIKTHRDHFVIDMDKEVLTKRFETFFNDGLSDDDVRSMFKLKESNSWRLSEVRKAKRFEQLAIHKIAYRPFDIQHIYYDSSIIDRDRINVMRHLFNSENIGLVFSRQATDTEWTAIQISNSMIDNRFHFSYKGIPLLAPLYLYPKSTTQQTTNGKPAERRPNLNKEIVEQISTTLGLTFTNEKEKTENCFAPIDLLDYIYAILHSPSYRGKYKEFLKIDFPRVPYPKDTQTFWQLVNLGSELRQVHLLESNRVEEYITTYPKDGDNVVSRKIVKKDWELYDPEKQLGRIRINGNQYFDQIPVTAWEFYIGGYQPAQKWLKDRKGRKLSYEDISHYQKIIVALMETDWIMKKIDKVSLEEK